MRRRMSVGTPSGLLMYSTGSPLDRKATPACCAERNPALQSRAEIACTFAFGCEWRGVQHHEGRQILIHAAEAIGDPRADARLAGDHDCPFE